VYNKFEHNKRGENGREKEKKKAKNGAVSYNSTLV
jgi:hypothetical protein